MWCLPGCLGMSRVVFGTALGSPLGFLLFVFTLKKTSVVQTIVMIAPLCEL